MSHCLSLSLFLSPLYLQLFFSYAHTCTSTCISLTCSFIFSLLPSHPILSLVSLSSQAGFYQTVLMLLLGYGVVVLTVLSISAIATSSTVEGGGVYCIPTTHIL